MKSDPIKRSVRVGLISLGCAKNLVDGEIMLGSLLKGGVEIVNEAAQADVVIVNTCSFIASAQEESVDTILQSAELREARNRGQGLVVAGCLPQRFREELPKLLPEVDAFMGIDQVASVSEIVHEALRRRQQRLLDDAPKPDVQRPTSDIVGRFAELERVREEALIREERQIVGASERERVRASRAPMPLTNHRPSVTDPSSLIPHPSSLSPLVEVDSRPTYIPDFATPRFRLTPKHFAYVKIAEGCNHPCSFCIIPRMRGSHRSRQQSDIAKEARQLIAEGVKELNLISQDSTYYGLDLRQNHRPNIAAPEKFRTATRSLPSDAATLCTLLRELNRLPGDFWIRLLYTHPAHWTDELIQTIADCPKVARYIDMPLQHIHPNMLERMRRETSQQYILDLIARIRAGIPGIALRTTFIVGFPGETEACFQTLLDFIRETRFERLGVFTYSREEGTRAASMANQVPEKIKQQRRNLAMAAQHEVAAQVSKSFVGQYLKVLVERAASAKELGRAKVVSWEHGQLRSSQTRNSKVETRNVLVARSEADAPDIDGRVYVRGKLPIGEFARVRVIGHTDYDLIAE